jgi:hypothetical protein
VKIKITVLQLLKSGLYYIVSSPTSPAATRQLLSIYRSTKAQTG